MRIAIFSDVHGNLTALQAVLNDIDQQEIDELFFAGDLCLFGPRPAACLERVRARDIAAIPGNTDSWIDGPPLLSQDLPEEKRERLRQVDDITSWTRTQLNVDDRTWLRSLPFHRRVSPTPNPRHDLFIVHANPIDLDQQIMPDVDRQKELFGEVRQTDDELHPLLKDILVGAIAYGHVHIPGVRHWGDLTLFNISSVSLPLDHDRRAKYGLLNWDGRRWSVEHRYVDYDIEEEIAAFETMRPPNWEDSVRKLREMLTW